MFLGSSFKSAGILIFIYVVTGTGALATALKKTAKINIDIAVFVGWQ